MRGMYPVCVRGFRVRESAMRDNVCETAGVEMRILQQKAPTYRGMHVHTYAYARTVLPGHAYVSYAHVLPPCMSASRESATVREHRGRNSCSIPHHIVQ